ncbi:MAG: filamentous hemagglutinin N-terminal domain-containing protein [Xenococcaceae cyanobacterium]
MLLQLSYRFFSRSIFSVLFLASINSGITQAQVVPDGTLPTNVEQLEMLRKITGGERVGDNLFHSFEEFSIPEGMEAIFENATDIQNIFTRITGSEISLIDGLLQTAGGANFFLINPNGIVFGQNAQIDVGGSFIATTANAIEFADGTSFAAHRNEPNVTLTISVPIGLGFYGNNGSITVNGTGNQITNDSNFSPIEFSQQPSGISAPDGQTIGLIGNGIDFNSGVVTTEGGNIYISSVESGSVGISQAENGLTLVEDGVTKYQDINLNQQSLIDASGEKVGNIFVSGQNINLKDGSFLLSQNRGSLSGGLINVNASETLNLSGTSPDGKISSNIRSATTLETTAADTLDPLNTRKGAEINIYANQISLQDQARIRTNSFNEFIGGNINITVSDLVKLSDSSIASAAFDTGDAGNINLVASEFQLSDVGSIGSATVGFGNGGEIKIEADLIDISGSSTTARSVISASSLSSGENAGDGGNITINTKELRIRDSASVSSSSFGDGNSGSITINAHESIEVSGKNPNFQGSNNPESTIRTAVQIANPGTQQAFELPALPTGEAGSLTINTPILNVAQEGVITVENQGAGSAGELNINANNLNLDQSGRMTAAAESGLGGEIFLNTQNLNISNDSEITAAAGGEGAGGNITINTTNLTAKKNNNITASAAQGEGGNITINADNSLSLNNQDSIATESASADGGDININTDQLQLNNNSQISTSAQGLGDGGNITINTDIFTALNNSEVTANAIEGNGGNITINTEGYFVSEDFVISASSEFGLEGTVEINIINEKDVNQGFILPEYPLISLESILAKSCLTKVGQDKYAIRINVLGKHLPLITSLGMDEGETLMQELEELEELEELSKVYLYSEQESAPDDVLIQAEHIIPTDDGRLLGVAEASIPSRCLHQ